MKNNLENSIKESLKGYEMSYDSSAWEALSKKLDHVMPVSPKSNTKWYLGGAATVAVIVTTIALWPAENNSTPKNIASNTNELNSVVNKGNVNSVSNNKGQEATATNQSTNKSNTLVDENVGIKTMATENPIISIGSLINPLNPTVNYQNTNGGSSNLGVGSNTGNEPIKIEIATVKDICFGENISISNKNEVSLIIVDPNGLKTTIKSNKTISFVPETDGKHSIGYIENDQYISKETFTVLPSPKADFSIDDKNIYEKGLPTVNVSTNSIGASYLWDFGKQTVEDTKETSVHYFKKDNYTISLTVEGLNGCKSKASQTVEIVDNYNLMAVLWLDLSNPTGSAYNSFMPYALTERQVDFKMKIIDLKDGGIVFETTDASDEWKGMDRRTGQQVEKNKAFMWTVSLNNPEKGEKSEYTGSVTTK